MSMFKHPRIAVFFLSLLLATQASPALGQTSSELKNFLSQKIGLSQDQILAIQLGKPFAKDVQPRSPAEIFVLGVIYVNAAPESYLKYATDLDSLRRYPEYLATNKFSDPPQLSDLDGFGFGSDDIKALKDCKPAGCSIQMPASTAMEDLLKSVNWGAPNVDDEVNHLVQKLALRRVLEYQRDGDRTLGAVYNEKGQLTNVGEQFKYMLSYYQVLPRDLPDFEKYLLDYPNGKPANVENSFHWEKVKFGMKPTLRIVHVLTMHGDKPDQPPYVIAEKQLYSSHYFETALDLTFVLRGSDDPKQSGFYLVKTMGCEQAVLTEGFKGSVVRRIVADRSTSDLEKSLASMKDILERQNQK